MLRRFRAFFYAKQQTAVNVQGSTTGDQHMWVLCSTFLFDAYLLMKAKVFDFLAIIVRG